jgi:hypothetical protein
MEGVSLAADAPRRSRVYQPRPSCPEAWGVVGVALRRLDKRPADVCLEAENVGFRGLSGHSESSHRRPLMTQSGLSDHKPPQLMQVL